MPFYLRKYRFLPSTLRCNTNTGLYLFPDQADTLDSLRQLKAGTVKHLRF
jgi:hypothetical protein